MKHGLASPDLFLAVLSHQVLDHIVLRGYDSRGQLLTWDLHSVRVTSFRTDYVRGGTDAGLDTFTLNYIQQVFFDPADALILGAPAQSPQGTPIVLTAQVKSLVATTGLHYTWTVTLNGKPAFNGPDAPTYIFTPSQSGTYVIGLSVQDAYGDKVTAARQTILILPDQIVISPGSGTPGQARSFVLGEGTSQTMTTSTNQTEAMRFPKQSSSDLSQPPVMKGPGGDGSSGHWRKQHKPPKKTIDELFRSGDLLRELVVSDLALALQ
jgi:hypothetical protein